jgi:tRNA (guanine-N7-)-methyltransferase
MSKRNKLQKFEDVSAFPNVLQCHNTSEGTLYHDRKEVPNPKGNWSLSFFRNKAPLTLELACGKGEYTTGLAARYPDKNFLGIDIKGARIWRGAKFALENNLKNVGFLRTRIEILDQYFDEQEVQEIWITFPDPFYKKENRRLVATSFLNMYAFLLAKKGVLHLKTDDEVYYEYALDNLSRNPHFELEYHQNDIYQSALYHSDLDIKTFYEKQHIESGKKIKYLKAIRSSMRLNQEEE